jgi:hypothetical protein
MRASLAFHRFAASSCRRKFTPDLFNPGPVSRIVPEPRIPARGRAAAMAGMTTYMPAGRSGESASSVAAFMAPGARRVVVLPAGAVTPAKAGVQDLDSSFRRNDGFRTRRDDVRGDGRRPEDSRSKSFPG